MLFNLNLFINALPTAHGQKNMNTQRTLDVEKVREFVEDFNKLFESMDKRFRVNKNSLQYCTVSLCYICSNFKIIEEICECDQEKWN